MGILSRHLNPTTISMRQRVRDLGWVNLGSRGYYNPYGLDYRITRKKEEECPLLRCRLLGHKWRKRPMSWIWYCDRKKCSTEEERYIPSDDGD